MRTETRLLQWIMTDKNSVKHNVYNHWLLKRRIVQFINENPTQEELDELTEVIESIVEVPNQYVTLTLKSANRKYTLKRDNLCITVQDTPS